MIGDETSLSVAAASTSRWTIWGEIRVRLLLPVPQPPWITTRATMARYVQHQRALFLSTIWYRQRTSHDVRSSSELISGTRSLFRFRGDTITAKFTPSKGHRKFRRQKDTGGDGLYAYNKEARFEEQSSVFPMWIFLYADGAPPASTETFSAMSATTAHFALTTDRPLGVVAVAGDRGHRDVQSAAREARACSARAPRTMFIYRHR